MKEIPKTKMKDAIILVCRDCPRETIWRMKHMPSYKATEYMMIALWADHS